MMPSRGIRGHGRGVHGPRCLPSSFENRRFSGSRETSSLGRHLPYLGKAVESRHIPVLVLLDAFDGDVDARTPVAVVLMPTVAAFEPLFVAVRSFRVPTHRTLLTRVFRVNPRCWNALESGFVRRVVLEGTEREVVQTSVHLSTSGKPRRLRRGGTRHGEKQPPFGGRPIPHTKHNQYKCKACI